MTLTQQDLEAIQKIVKSELAPVEKRLQGEFIPIRQEIKDIREQISSNPIMTIRSIREDLIIKSYPVGHHMVYSILYADHDLKIEDLIKIELFEFYRKYESCILSKNFKPVISITSGRGELDYRKTLAELELAYKKGHK